MRHNEDRNGRHIFGASLLTPRDAREARRQVLGGYRPAADGGGEDGNLGILWRPTGAGGEPKVVVIADEVVVFVILRRCSPRCRRRFNNVQELGSRHVASSNSSSS
jgi:hypothetical protein